MSLKWIAVPLAATMAWTMACASPDACEVAEPTHLGAAAAPSAAQLRALLLDAERQSHLTDRLTRDLHYLRAAMDTGGREERCRALRAARATLQSAPDDASTAAQRSVVALVLDLTAASLLRSPRGQLPGR